MVFEGELAFESVEDGLDPLADSAEFPESFLLVLAIWADQVRADFVGDEAFELAPGEFPGMKTENGILTMGADKAAWFKDSEGDILCVSSMS